MSRYTTSWQEVRAARKAGKVVTLSGRGGWYIEEENDDHE
jgi:hypothetical protein